MLEYFTIFMLPNLSKTEKKTMNIAQRSHFDRSFRSVHVTRACKQAPLAHSWADNELNVTSRLQQPDFSSHWDNAIPVGATSPPV